MDNYDHKKIEKKWQNVWEKKKLYEVKNGAKGKCFYGLIEFPYPSGSGLHVGHIRSNTAMDIITRKRRMEGYNVLFPIGWDAFGLPTENYAIKTGIQPEKVTKINTNIFRKQLKSIGFGFDWSREINTTDPAYYKWTQWIFLQMYKKGLAYKSRTTINWCPKDKIGLANEEVVNGCCERCGEPTAKKEKEQWMLAITKYADRLDKDLDDVDYLEKIKIQQRNWIGKSEGSEINFEIIADESFFSGPRTRGTGAGARPFEKTSIGLISIFTTRADTIFGATYVVLAPEHELVKKLRHQIQNWDEVEKYIQSVNKKTEMERTAEDKEKTGVELKGIKAINPASGEEIPVWIADYVLASYGTGAIMAVPAHDERDFAFAKKYELPIRQVIMPYKLDSNNPPRAGKENTKRNIVHVILRNPKNKTVLVEYLKGENWGDIKPKNFIIGGIEGNESEVEASIREIKEETGYINVKFIQKIPLEVQAEFFAAHKDVNRVVQVHTLVFDIIDEKQVEISEEEKKLHDLKWIQEKNVFDTISIPDDKMTWRYLYEGGFAFIDNGIVINSEKFNGKLSNEIIKEITEFVGGKIVTKYKLRDWIFSRQRYWGEPIPIVHCKKCGYVPVPEKDLPIILPKVKSYVPTDNGESPLAIISKWVNTTCPKCKGEAKRETDTMPNWAGSSWYFLRYTDPKNKKELASKKSLSYWMKKGVDWYNGGMEHTTLHLLYSRFWHKFLYDLKIVPTSEPYMKRTSHGMILAGGGDKMSKSKGNTINPDDIVRTYGADTLRIYEMFIGPFDQAVVWNTNSIIGSRRFLDKIWRIGERIVSQNGLLKGPRAFSPDRENLLFNSALITILHKTIKKVSEDVETMDFNTAISSMMVLVNEMEKSEISIDDFKMFLQILAPFAPHLAEDLWRQLGGKKSIHKSAWPKWNKNKIIDEMIKIAVQVNGKVRTELMIKRDADEEEIKVEALKDKAIIPWLLNKEVKKIIYVKNRLINIVI